MRDQRAARPAVLRRHPPPRRPGSIGQVYEDLRKQLNSIGALLTPLPKDLRILPAQGEETTVGDEDARWETWGSLAQDD